eukprot:scaffold82245_cov39-Tisochrysis_lutea.AAC.1
MSWSHCGLWRGLALSPRPASCGLAHVSFALNGGAPWARCVTYLVACGCGPWASSPARGFPPVVGVCGKGRLAFLSLSCLLSYPFGPRSCAPCFH